MSQLIVRVIEAKDLKAADVHVFGANSSDPFVEIRIKDDSNVYKTKVINKNLNPTWNEQFTFTVQHPHADILQLKVYDYDVGSNNDLLGGYEIPISTLITNPNVDAWYELWKDLLHKKHGKGSIHLALHFTPGPGVAVAAPTPGAHPTPVSHPPTGGHTKPNIIPGSPYLHQAPVSHPTGKKFASVEEAIAAADRCKNLYPPSLTDPKTIPYRWPAIAKRWVAKKWGIPLPTQNPAPKVHRRPPPQAPHADDPIPAAWRTFANNFPTPGYVVFWNDASFNTDRAMYVLANNRTPYMFVYCATETDVINTMTFAQQQSLPISVKSQGHCFTGYSQINFGVVIDVSLMNSITPNFTNMTATVGPGAQNHQISDALGDSYATTVGGCPQVGVGGYTLGGGFGLLSRSYGVMCDNVISMRVVLPPTKVGGAPQAVYCDINTLSDLYASLCGGGNGNFGVVTQFVFKIYAIPAKIYTTQIEWPLTVSTLQNVLNWMADPNTPPEFAGDVVLYRDPTYANQLVLYWFGLYNGDPTVGQVIYQKFVTAVGATPLTNTSVIQSFKDFIGDDFSKPHNIFARNAFVNATFPTAAATYIINMLGSSWGNPSATIEFCGGAINTQVGTAFNHRSSNFLFDYGGKWAPTALQDKAAAMAWANEVRDNLSGYMSNESYQNYPEDDLMDWQSRYYPNIYSAMQIIKAKYDPLNVFYYEQSVMPASHQINHSNTA